MNIRHEYRRLCSLTFDLLLGSQHENREYQLCGQKHLDKESTHDARLAVQRSAYGEGSWEEARPRMVSAGNQDAYHGHAEAEIGCKR